MHAVALITISIVATIKSWPPQAFAVQRPRLAHEGLEDPATILHALIETKGSRCTGKVPRDADINRS
jgi:hypothetical protein